MDLLKNFAGILLGICIGAGSRWLGIPSPAPGALLGALLVLNMCMGFLLMGWLLGKEPAGPTLIGAGLVIVVSTAWVFTDWYFKPTPPPETKEAAALQTPGDKGRLGDESK